MKHVNFLVIKTLRKLPKKIGLFERWNPFQFSEAVQLQVSELVAHEICYFLKEIRGPVFYRFDEEQFFAKLRVFELLRFFLEKAKKISSDPYNFWSN